MAVSIATLKVCMALRKVSGEERHAMMLAVLAMLQQEADDLGLPVAISMRSLSG